MKLLIKPITVEMAYKFVKESEFKRWYGTKTKKIILIDVKPRNKETWDRLGAVRY